MSPFGLIRFQDRYARALALIFLAGLALRLAYLFEISGDVLYKYPILDEGHYYSTAIKMASGEAVPGPYWRPPGLYFALAAIAKLTGPGPFQPRLAQVILSALSVLLLYALGRRHFSKQVTLLAALFIALNGVLISAAVELKDTTWTLFLNLLALYFITRGAREKSGPLMLAGGLAVGLSILFRPILILFVPVLIFWLLLHARGKRWMTLSAALLLGTLLPILPVTIENNRHGGPFVLVSTNGGMNFFIGNNADYARTVTARPGNQWDETVLEPARRAGFHHEGPDRDRWYFGAGLDFLVRHPVEGAMLMTHKFALFFNGREIPRDTDIYLDAEHSRILRFLVMNRWPFAPMGLLIPLALFGILRTRRRFRKRSILLLFLLVQAVTVAAFFVSSRYRVPAIPVLALFAAVGTFQAIALFRASAAPRRIAMAAGALTAMAFLNLPAFETRQSLGAERLFFQANAFANERRFDEARAHYRRAAAMDPTDARPRRGLADRLEVDGEPDEAVGLWREVIRIGPYSARDRDRLLMLLLNQGRRREAAEALNDDIAATSNADRKAVAHFRLGVLFFEDNLLAESIEEFRRACALDAEQCARSLRRWGRENHGATAADSSSSVDFWRDLAVMADGTGW